MRQVNRKTIGAIRRQIDCTNLTADRERDLLKTLRSSPDEPLRQAALDELWKSHSKLVVAIARRHRHPKVDLLDLIGAGHLGLHAAISRFDPDRYRTRLSSYAIPWIRWYLQDYLQRNSGPVRLPGSAGHRQLLRMAGRLYADARRSCERERVEATEAELCDRIGRRVGLSGDDVASSLQLLHGGTVSLDASPTGDVSSASVLETLADGDAASEDQVIRRLDRARARARIISLARETLGERERTVFFARCMNSSDEAEHLSSIAVRLNVSPERVYQIEASARRKVAEALAGEGYTELLSNGRPIALPGARAQRRRPPPAPAASIAARPALA